MRFPLIFAAALLAAPPATAETYRTGLGTVSETVMLADGGAVLVIGSAVAEIPAGGAVTASVLVDGAPCARSVRDGVTGIAMAKASCLIEAEPGRSHVVELVESHSAGTSRRSTLRTRVVADPTIPGTLLGEASGSAAIGASVSSAVALAIAVTGTADIEFADAPHSLTGKAGIGSVEAVARTGDAVEVCFEAAFNQFGGAPAETSCRLTAPAGTPVAVGMSVPVGAGARVSGARLSLRTAE